MKTINKQIQRKIQYLIAMACIATMMTSCGAFGTEFLSVLGQSMGGYGQTFGSALTGGAQNYRQQSTQKTYGTRTASYGNIATASKPQSVTQSDDSKSTEPAFDTSRIDRQISEFEEELKKEEMREAKEHNTMRSIRIQELKANIKDLKKYREQKLRGR